MQEQKDEGKTSFFPRFLWKPLTIIRWFLQFGQILFAQIFDVIKAWTGECNIVYTPKVS